MPRGRMRPMGPERPDSGNGPENQDSSLAVINIILIWESVLPVFIPYCEYNRRGGKCDSPAIHQ